MEETTWTTTWDWPLPQDVLQGTTVTLKLQKILDFIPDFQSIPFDDVRREKAQLIMEKYENLLDIGVDEKDALCILGITEKKFDKIKSYLA